MPDENGDPQRYTREEVDAAIAKSRAVTDIMSPRQKEYFLGVLMAKYIADGEMALVAAIAKKVVERVR